MITDLSVKVSNGMVTLKVDSIGVRFTKAEALGIGRALIDRAEELDSRGHVLILDVEVPEEAQRRNIMFNAIRILVEKNDGQLTFNEVTDLVELAKELEALKSE